jgi:hypothetical protein
MTHGSAAIVRLWIWRIAGLKLMLPFSLLHALGGWLGFPSPHSADPAPHDLIRVLDLLAPLASPAHELAWSGWTLALATLGALSFAAACAYMLRGRLKVEREKAQAETARRERDIDDVLPRPGFLGSAAISAFVLCAVAIPMLAGAVRDRQQRLDWLIENSLALRNAPVTLVPATPGMGERYRVEADAHGVTIRNANIHDLVAIAYGVKRHAVITPQMYSGMESAGRSWMHWPRYDVRVQAQVPEPRDFDSYALRQNLTKALSEQFGLEIYLNGDCQPPCGTYHLALADDPL